MVKKISLLIFITIVSTCNSYKSLFPKNECGRFRIKRSYSLKSVDESFYQICDTSSVYKYNGEISRDRENNLYYKKNGYNNYYKFYKDGKVGYFGLEENGFLSKTNMYPCQFINAYYGLNTKGNLILKRFVVTVANGEYVSTNFLVFKGDTLEVIEKDMVKKGYKKIYIKQKIPKEWLIYKPDW